MSTYTLTYECGTKETIEAETLVDAREIARERATLGWEPSDSTHWHDVTITDEDGEEETVTAQVDPGEPDCSYASGHEWVSPLELVGGLKENPGVWGHGGGVYIKELCLHCGCERTTDTWANDTRGRQGLTSVKYERGAYGQDDLERVCGS